MCFHVWMFLFWMTFIVYYRSIYLQKLHLNIKYNKGNTNWVEDGLTLPLFVELITILNSCRNMTSQWPHLYDSDLNFIASYYKLVESKQVSKFHLQDGLICRLIHIYLPSCESNEKMIWNVFYKWVIGNLRILEWKR